MELRWECTEKQKKSCKVRIKSSNGNFVEQLNDHVHPTDIEKINMRRATNDVRNRGDNTNERPQNIVANAVLTLNEEANAIGRNVIAEYQSSEICVACHATISARRRN